MCIFSRPVVSVTDTNIFARRLPGGWQHLVYQMKFESKEPNSMILPLPVALPASGESAVTFISLEKHPRFFEELERGFPVPQPDGAVPSRSGGPGKNSLRPKLKVEQVGQFIASFVPTTADFDRLDEQFRLPPQTWDQIPSYSDYGFAVFQLKSLSGKPHPMAFQFRSRLAQSNGGTLFFPTVHIHDGEVHDREEFDHTLYLQAPEFDDACGDYQGRFRLTPDAATG